MRGGPPGRSPSARGWPGRATRGPRRSAGCGRRRVGVPAGRRADGRPGSAPGSRSSARSAGTSARARSAPGPNASARTSSTVATIATVAGPSGVRVAHHARPVCEVDRRIAAPARQRRERPAQVERTVERPGGGGHRPGCCHVSWHEARGERPDAAASVGQTGGALRTQPGRTGMRILVVGAGGVGSAVVPIAVRRDFFERMVVADYDLGRAERAVARFPDDRRLVAARVDASRAEDVAALCREHAITHVLNAVDPRFVMPIFDGAFAAGADYLDMAMSLSHPDPDAPYERTGVKLGDEQFAKADATGRVPGGWRWSASASSPGCRTSSRATPRTTCSPRSTRSASATGRTSSSTATTSRRRSRSGRPSRSASTRRSSGRRTGAGTRRRRSASPRCSTSRRASARSSASTSSTRRSCSSRAGSRRQAGDLQVRPRRRVHQRPEGPPHARARPDRQGPGRWGRGVAAGRGGRRACRIRPSSATGCAARRAPGRW